MKYKQCVAQGTNRGLSSLLHIVGLIIICNSRLVLKYVCASNQKQYADIGLVIRYKASNTNTTQLDLDNIFGK